MKIAGYREFSDELARTAQSDPRVVGLVAVGSMSEVGSLPDAWSDHDFFLIVQAGEQEAYRSDLSWLPQAGEIALSFRDTEHGLKVVYTNGHLLEFAVFDSQEIRLAGINRYRVIVDKADIQSIVRAVAQRPYPQLPDSSLAGQFLANLIVASGRWKRGEKLSARFFLAASAVPNLARLMVRYIPAGNRDILDNLDPLRRLELVYPAQALEIAACLDMEVPEGAAALLRIAEREMRHLFSLAALEAVRKALAM